MSDWLQTSDCELRSGDISVMVDVLGSITRGHWRVALRMFFEGKALAGLIIDVFPTMKWQWGFPSKPIYREHDPVPTWIRQAAIASDLRSALDPIVRDLIRREMQGGPPLFVADVSRTVEEDDEGR